MLPNIRIQVFLGFAVLIGLFLWKILQLDAARLALEEAQSTLTDSEARNLALCKQVNRTKN